MGASQSKKFCARLRHKESSLSSTKTRKTRQVPSGETGSTDHRVCKQFRHRLSSRKLRLLGLKKTWPGYTRRTHETQSNECEVGSTAPMPWFDKPQQQNALVSRDECSGDGTSLSVVRTKVCGTGSPSDIAEGDILGAPEEFSARPVPLQDYGTGSPLCQAYADCLAYMEEEVVHALHLHPCPNEADVDKRVAKGEVSWACLGAAECLEPTVEPSLDVLAYVYPGTYFKAKVSGDAEAATALRYLIQNVFDFTAYHAHLTYLLRLKTSEGWVTGVSIRMPRPTNASRFVAARPSSSVPSPAKAGSQQRGASAFRVTLLASSQYSSGDPGRCLLRSRCIVAPGDTQGLGGLHVDADETAHVDELLATTCFGTINACRATRFCSFGGCAGGCAYQAEERHCYASLTHLASASCLQRCRSTLSGISSRPVRTPGLDKDGEVVCSNTPTQTQFANIARTYSCPSGSMSPMEHPFVLFRVASSHGVLVSVACCRSTEDGDCPLSGVGPLGIGGRDVVHVALHESAGFRKTSKCISGCSRNSRVQLRLCTMQGWVTFDGSIEKVDECDSVSEGPILYEIVAAVNMVCACSAATADATHAADGYLVNVRASLEIEGPVRRTLPPATIVEVFERKVNAEGLVRLRLADGWINERRRGTDGAGLLFAVRVGDHHADAVARQITAVGILLHALCSSNTQVRIAAATWLAANTALSGVASAALMEVVDKNLVVAELKHCRCYYWRGCNSQTNIDVLERKCLSSCQLPLGCATDLKGLSSPAEKNPSVLFLEEGQMAAGVPSNPPSTRCNATSDVPCRLKPSAANDLLLGESPVIELSDAKSFPCPTEPLNTDGDRCKQAEPVHGFRHALSEEEESCFEGSCHKRWCYLERGANPVPDMTEASRSVGEGENGKECDGIWRSLFALVQAASALPDLPPLSVSCLHCPQPEGKSREYSQKCSSYFSAESGDECEPTLNCVIPRPYSNHGRDFPVSDGTPQRATGGSLNGKVVSVPDYLDDACLLRTRSAIAPLPSPSHPQLHLVHCTSLPELGLGVAYDHCAAVCREVLSPTEPLYHFCVAAVYSSLTEHREPLGPHASYRPPIGIVLSEPLAPMEAFKHVLAAYKLQLNAKAKAPMGSSTRSNSFSFHHPPIIVIHKIETICNHFLVRRYLHERSMLMLMNTGGGCKLDEAIPNPLLKVEVLHRSQMFLNEYFLFHGCTEERAGLIATSGFDFRRGGENGGKLFGIGTYFSPNASKADLYTRPPDTSARIAGPGPTTAVAFHNSAPAFTFNAARLAPQPIGRVPAATRAVPTVGPAAAADSAIPKASGNLRLGRLTSRKMTWLGGGRGTASSTQLTPASPNPVVQQQDGTTKADKETGVLRATCSKLMRHGNAGSADRSKDSLVSGSLAQSLQAATAQQQTSSQQHPKPHDATGAKPQHVGLYGGSHKSTAPPAMRCLILARVCLGEVYKAISPMPEARMPPNKPDPVAAKLSYDSVMAECRKRGGVVDGVEFVVFERAQALPQFIVTYSHAAHCQCAECHRQHAL